MTTTTCVSPADITTRISEQLARTVGARRFAMWFDKSACFDYCNDGQKFRVVVPNRFVADWITRNFHQNIEDVIHNELGQNSTYDLHVDPQRFDRQEILQPDSAVINNQAEQSIHKTVHPPAQSTRIDRSPYSSGSGLTTRRMLRHQLDDFIVGPSNELAYLAANRVIDDHDIPAHPLFIHGGCGLGKTHLLQGICRKMLETHPHAKVLYTTGEQFTNEYVSAVRKNNLDAFRRKMRRLDLLAVDDIHFIANKQATQQEFLHSFDEIELGGSKLILASDCHPKLIQQFSAALVSRCVRGLVVQIRPPDLETRLAMIRRLARRRGLVMLDQVAEHIAARCEASVRDIEGIITKLHALATLVHGPDNDHGHAGTRPIGYALAERVFNDCDTQIRTRKPVQFETIINEVCHRIGVDCRQVIGSCRHKSVVLARTLTIHLARELTAMSYPEIAGAMNRSNHSTIITAAQRMRKMIAANQSIILPNEMTERTPAELIEQLKRKIIRSA